MILHLDLDAFFVSAHRVEDKSLEGIAVAVGGRSDPFIFDKGFNRTKVSCDNSGAFVPPLFQRDKKATFKDFFQEGDRVRGIVITCSYEARKMGIKTGMSIKEALNIYPKLKILPPEHRLYHHFSTALKDWLCLQIPVIEQYSIDEFFADVTGWIDESDVVEFATHIRDEILKKFGLPISIGIAKSKWIAKFATSYAKPYGVKMILPCELENYLDVPVEVFPGIGRSFTKKLHQHKKFTLLDIKNSKALLYSFNKNGKDIYDRVCGIEKERVIPKGFRESVGISRTFDAIQNRQELKRRVIILSRHLVFMICKFKVNPTTVYFGIKYEYASSKKQITFNRVFNELFFVELCLDMFRELDIYKNSKVIKISINLRNFQDRQKSEYSLFEYEKDKKYEKLLKSTTKMREKYGIDILRIATEIIK